MLNEKAANQSREPRVTFTLRQFRHRRHHHQLLVQPQHGQRMFQIYITDKPIPEAGLMLYQLDVIVSLSPSFFPFQLSSVNPSQFIII